MWRWSLQNPDRLTEPIVFSTYVEVIPISIDEFAQKYGILHVCGGDPLAPRATVLKVLYSPRMWRWSLKFEVCLGFQFVFSTYVEVILADTIIEPAIMSILHVCGGDPTSFFNLKPKCLYSPRMWRWSQRNVGKSIWDTVFSTYVEVILATGKYSQPKLCILHVCGGDPYQDPLF